MSPGLLAQSLVLGILTGGMYALMAAGLTLIFGVMKVINVAHAAIIVMGAYLSLTLFRHLGIDPLLSVLLLIGLYALLTFTKLGRAIRATIQNRTAAQLVGVDVRLVTTVSFAIGIAIAGAAGPLLGMLFTFYPATHWLWIGKLLAIVVLGGLGSLRGAFVAAMLLGIAEQVTSVTLALGWAPMIFYVFLFGVLVVRPQGMFGAVERQSL